MLEFLVVGIGGFIGSCMRFVITSVLNSIAPDFPYGTLFSNIVAAFLIGFIIGLDAQSIGIPPKARLFFTTGLLGGLSTFSTFSMETIVCFKKGEYILATINILTNLVLSLSLVIVGLAVAKFIFKST